MQLPVWATTTLIRTWCEKPSVCLKANKVKPGFTSLLVFLVGCFLAPLHVCWKTRPTCCVCQQGSYRCNREAFTWRKCQSSPALKGWHIKWKTHQKQDDAFAVMLEKNVKSYISWVSPLCLKYEEKYVSFCGCGWVVQRHYCSWMPQYWRMC